MINRSNLTGKSLKHVWFPFLFLCVVSMFFCCSSKESGEIDDKNTSSAVESSRESGLSGQAVSPGTATYSLTIVPVNATRSTTIYANPSGFSLADAKVDWLMNNVIVKSTDARQFKAEKASKGNMIQARAAINGQLILSNTIQISNSPPVVINAVFTPEKGNKLSVEATASDLDEDEITISYEWIRNGELSGNSREIDVPLTNGDNVQIKITPFDGESYGKTVILYKKIIIDP